MPNAYEIKVHINSISDTKKVTDAMFMISSVKMRKASQGVLRMRPYFDALQGEIRELVSFLPENDNRYFRVPEPSGGKTGRHGILLVTSDRGLSGGYNQTAIRMVETFLRTNPETVVFIVGEYGRQYFSSHGLSYEKDFAYSAEQPSVRDSRRICEDLLEAYNTGKVDDVGIIYTDYGGGHGGECRRITLLPLERSSFVTGSRIPDFKEFSPDPISVLEGIIPSYLTGFVYSSLVDSYCSEQQARMAAMKTAGENAEAVLKKLQVEYNRIRQAEITREMTEITSGAKAMKAAREKKKQKERLAAENGGTL